MATLIIAILVAAAFAAAIYAMTHNKGGCAGCTGCSGAVKGLGAEGCARSAVCREQSAEENAE